MSLLRPLMMLLLFLYAFVAFGQRINKQFMVTLPYTSVKTLEHMQVTFDLNGNYCYYPETDSFLIVTNTHTYGPFTKNNNIFPTSVFYSIDNNGQYIKGAHNTDIYGPVKGKIKIESTRGTGDYFAYTISSNDTVGYYINGIHIATTNSPPCIEDWWCAFSNNGNVLYTIRKGMWSYLFLDHKLIDSSQSIYKHLAVDNEHSYRYSFGYTHEKQKMFGPVAAERSVFNHYDASLYFYGNGNDASYPIADDSLYTDPDNGWRHIIAPGHGKNFLSYTPEATLHRFHTIPAKNTTCINVNGKAVVLPYSYIYAPNMDSLGNYALFGLRDYYLYKNINGVEQPQPLSKYGVRAKPISIDAQGNAICYYRADDSTYIYQNDRLFKKCPNAMFCILWEDALLRIHSSREVNEQPILGAFYIDSLCYVTYKNTISPPILKPIPYFDRDTSAGKIIYSIYNDNGYWLLQKTGFRTYKLLINNRVIELPQGIDLETPIWFQLSENFAFTGTEFIFYALEKNSIYRYQIIL